MEYEIYKHVNNSELRELQICLLNIIRVFVSICERHELRYVMIGGTMLGAMRHNGFIPWDDDVDVGMPRPDYEKFIEVVQKELPEGYSFLNYKTEKNYKRYFSRVIDRRIHIYNDSYSEEIVEDAWIDIFPIDAMPDNRIKQKLHFWYLTGLRLLYHMSSFDELVNLNRPGRPRYQQFIIDILSRVKIGRNWDTKKLLFLIERGLCKYNYDNEYWVANFFGPCIEKEIIPKIWIGKRKKYKFEDMELYGVDNPEAFLTNFYGDWRTPPSDLDKNKHRIRKIVYLQSEQGKSGVKV